MPQQINWCSPFFDMLTYHHRLIMLFLSATCSLVLYTVDKETRWNQILAASWAPWNNVKTRLHINIKQSNKFVFCESKKTINLTFDHNFGKCRPIYKILSLSDSWGNFVHTYHKDSSHLKYLVKFDNYTRSWFQQHIAREISAF